MPEGLSRLREALADRYLVQNELGRGGMAVVYRAQDIKHDRPVALKVLRPSIAAVLPADRFLREIRVTARLQHPNILPLFDSGEASHQLYYVMPYFEGDNLKTVLSQEGNLGVQESVAITTALASALEHAHRIGIVHRDLKPENILFQERQPLIADFGVALAVQVVAGERITGTGVSVGTPQYMSPEQAAGEPDLDGRSDIYSLGCLLYEMLGGRPPHEGRTPQGTFARVVVEPPAPIASLRGNVPPHVEDALSRALEKDPINRFQSASDFASALKLPTAQFPVMLKREGRISGAVARLDTKYKKVMIRIVWIAVGALLGLTLGKLF